MNPNTKMMEEAQQQQLAEFQRMGRALIAVCCAGLVLILWLAPWYVSFCKRVSADADAYRIRVIQQAERGCK